MGRRGAPPDRGGQLDDERHHRFDAELAKIVEVRGPSGRSM